MRSSQFFLYFGILMVKNYCWPENRAEELQNSSQYNSIYALLKKFLRAVRYCYDIQLSCSIYTWLLHCLKHMQGHSQRHQSWIYNFLGKAQLNSSSPVEMVVSFGRLCINIKHKDQEIKLNPKFVPLQHGPFPYELFAAVDWNRLRAKQNKELKETGQLIQND